MKESPVSKEKSKLIALEVYEVSIDSEWQMVSGFVNAYLPLEDSIYLEKGDLIYVSGKPNEVSPPANPGEFNYKNYLAYNRIYHQHFIREDLAKIGHKPPPFFVEYSDRLRNYCIDVIADYIQNEDSRAVILALSLGVKDELENDLVRAFSATGAMHVLAVSGLHVGIIYLLLFQVFQRLGLSKKKYRWLMAILSIVILWFYALLTGLSPSVLRAVTMFSFVAMGRALFRNGNIYNTLAASAFVLLWFNPYLIMSIGFQLSYLAVFGIVYIQLKLYELWAPKYWLLDKIWAISCVSIAAQLATGPLSILYFHQFPTYFLISNLFIIPAAFVTLIGALLLMILSFIPALAAGLGWLLNGFVGLVNKLVFWVGSFSGSTIEGIHLDILQTWLVYFTLGGMILFFVKKKMNWLYLSFLTSFAFAFVQISHFSKAAKSLEFSHLNVNNSQVLDLRVGFDSKIIADSLFLADDESQRFHLHQKSIISGSNQNIERDELRFPNVPTELGDVFVIEGRTALIMKKSIPLDQELIFDFVFIDGRQFSFDEDFLGSLKAEEYVLGNNLWRNTETDLRTYFETKDLSFHSIKTEGYFSHLWRR